MTDPLAIRYANHRTAARRHASEQNDAMMMVAHKAASHLYMNAPPAPFREIDAIAKALAADPHITTTEAALKAAGLEV